MNFMEVLGEEESLLSLDVAAAPAADYMNGSQHERSPGPPDPAPQRR